MKKLFLIIFFIIFSCNNISSNSNLNELIDAYIFLSENHALLHIMMGEYEGSPFDSYKEYKRKISYIKDNICNKIIILSNKNIILF